MTGTFWNGEPCEARHVRVIVGKALRPTWWCANLEGTERLAIEVKQHGQVFFLDNADSSGWRKVTEGRGMPNFPHSSLPGDSTVVWPSEEESESLKSTAEMMEKMSNLMQRKIEECFRCGTTVKAMEKIGRCVYARPCGCRLWQGTVPGAWKSRKQMTF